MKKFFAALLFSLAFVPSVFAQDITTPYYSGTTFDLTGDSRTADAMASVTCGPVCGTVGTNWFVQASALAGQRYSIGLNQAISGTRSDQYLAPANFQPIINSKSAWLIIGYPAINDIGQVGGNATYTNINGVFVDASNVAYVTAQNLLGAVRQATGAGKKVILLHEPGNTSSNNGALIVANFTGNIPNSTTLNVTAVANGIIRTPQTVIPGQLIPNTAGLVSAATASPGTAQLGGGSVTAGTNIVAQLTGTDGSACPAAGASVATSTCTGGIGTYQINNTLNLTSQAFLSTYSMLAAVYELNSYIDAIGVAFPGSVYVVNNNPALWNFTGSATSTQFKTGTMIDGNGTTTGTHFNVLGGYYGAVSFNSAMQTIILGTDVNSASINDVLAANPRSLLNNPLFQTASGGSGAASCTTTGTVPLLWTQACGVVSTTVTITQAADTNQLYGSAAIPLAGNAVTLAIASSGPDTYRLFSTAPVNSAWNLSDWLQGGMITNVAAGSSKCAVYGGLDFSTDVGTRTSYSMYGAGTPSNGGVNDGPTTAYAYTLRNPAVPAAPGSTTKAFARWILYVKLSAAGNCTVTVSRPWFNRVKVYNPATGTFSGWLLRRDLDPAANDNTPAFMFKAG